MSKARIYVELFWFGCLMFFLLLSVQLVRRMSMLAICIGNTTTIADVSGKKTRTEYNAYPKLFGKFMWCDHFDTFTYLRILNVFVLWVEKAERNAHHHHQKQWKDEVNVKQQRNSIMQNTNNKTCPNELQCRVNVRDREKRLARKHSTARRKYVSEYEWLKRESMQ